MFSFYVFKMFGVIPVTYCLQRLIWERLHSYFQPFSSFTALNSVDLLEDSVAGYAFRVAGLKKF